MTDTKYPFKVVRVNTETGDRLTVGVFQNRAAAIKFLASASLVPPHRLQVEVEE
ncbi:hypothetical protein [Fodinicola feengrottensis]|uniref:SPOR domain-containing protein n=1 Tax=Fodinicola feengrottensis TaxID=435914 RepID=A0ABP4UEI5_9ACTN|nr:hypothetical protein [Fodinicola feengrottensis]